MEDDVLGNEPNQPSVADKGAGKDEVTISKAELDSLRRERDEARQSERDWANMARRNNAPAPQPVVEEEEGLDPADYTDIDEPQVKGDTPEKLVDDLAAEGAAALGKRGFITAADAKRMAVEIAAKVTRELIGRERSKMASDATIMAEFPDLKDQKSELWAETAKRYQRAVAMDPNAKKTPAALYLAAEAARESLKAKNAGRRREDDDDDDNYRGEREPEEDRRRRADSQDARPRGRQAADDMEDMLGSEARQIAKAMGVSDAEFKASRKELGDQRPRGRR